MAQLSEEQQQIVDLVGRGENVVCISKPGTGKTTVAIAASVGAQPFGRALHLTYTRTLKEESRERVDKLGLADLIDVDSYHAAAARLFLTLDETSAPDETLIYAALANAPKAPIDYGLLVLDEAQDLTPLYVEFVQHLLRHCARPPHMLVIGDPFQRIFGYRGASWRYMTEPERHFGPLLRAPAFAERHLTVCWRITPEMAEWINLNLSPLALEPCVPAEWWDAHGALLARWWAGGVRSGKPSAPGSMVYLDEAEDDVARALAHELASFAPAECALLARSVRHPPRTLTDVVQALDHVDWCVTNASSPWEASARAATNKTLATTVHRFKGLERPFICLIGLDARWETPGADPLDAFALLFVACTRAQRKFVAVRGRHPPYATLRGHALKGERRPARGSVHSLLQHTPFDGPLSTPRSVRGEGLLDATLEYEGAKVEPVERFVPSRADGQEDVSAFLDDAVVAATVLRGDREHGRVRVAALLNGQRAIPLGVAQWLHARRSPAWQWTAADAFLLVVAERCVADAYVHTWRQVRSTPALVRTIEACAASVQALLRAAAEVFGRPFQPMPPGTLRLAWDAADFKAAYEPSLWLRDERPQFWSEDDERMAVVHVLLAPALRHDVVLFVAACAAFLSLAHKKPCQAMVAIPNEGSLYCVHRECADFELLSRVCCRKLNTAFDPQRCSDDYEAWVAKDFF